MKKPSLALLIGMHKPSASKDMGEPDGDEESKDGDEPHVDAAHSVLDAVKANDAEALSEALKVFYDLCKEEGGEY